MSASVVIVGGGPVGTFAALLLAKYGIRSSVIERRESINPHPKSRSVSRRTMEIMRGLGITDDDFVPLSLPPSWTQVLVYTTTLTGHEIGRVRCPDFETVPIAASPSMPHMSSQEKYEKVLRDLVDDCPLIDFQGNATVLGIEQSAQECALTVERANGAKDTLLGDYVLFADGASSRARSWLGVEMQGQYEIATVLDVHFDVVGLTEQVLERAAPLLFVASDAGVGVYQPIDGKTEWRCQIFAAGATPESIDAAAWIRGTAGDDSLDVHVRSVRPWTMHSITADKFRVGRAFLIGDAVHVLPPTGGLGLNSGLQGTHNLIWKLAGVIQGWAADALLETYEQERRAVTAVNAQASVRNNANFGSIGQAYRSNGDVEGALRQAQSYGRFVGLDLGVRYAAGAFVSDGTSPTPLCETSEAYDGSAAPGVRAPHVWLERGSETISTLDLFDSAFCLLVGAQGGAWIDAAVALHERFNIPIAAHMINGADGRLTSSEWGDAYGVTESGAVLVRPDGHVGFRQPTGADNHRQVLASALAKCLGKSTL